MKPRISPLATRLMVLVAFEAVVRGGWPDRGAGLRHLLVRDPGALPSWTTWAYILGHLVIFLLLLARRCDPGRTMALGFGFIALSRPIVASVALSRLPDARAWSAAMEIDGVGYALFAAASFAIGATILPRRWLLLGPTLYFVAEYAAGWIREAWISPWTHRLYALDPSATTYARISWFEYWVPGGLMLALAVGAWIVLRPSRSLFSEGDEVPPTESVPISTAQAISLGAIVTLAYLTIWLLDLVPINPDPALDVVLPIGFTSLATVIYYVGVVAMGVGMIAMTASGTGTGRVVRWMTLTTIGFTVLGWGVPPARPSFAFGLDLVVPLLSAVVTLRLVRGLRPEARLAGAFGLGASIGLFRHPLELASEWVVAAPQETLLPAVGTGLVGVTVLALIALIFGASRPMRRSDEPLTPLET